MIGSQQIKKPKCGFAVVFTDATICLSSEAKNGKVISTYPDKACKHEENKLMHWVSVHVVKTDEVFWQFFFSFFEVYNLPIHSFTCFFFSKSCQLIITETSTCTCQKRQNICSPWCVFSSLPTCKTRSKIQMQQVTFLVQ